MLSQFSSDIPETSQYQVDMLPRDVWNLAAEALKRLIPEFSDEITRVRDCCITKFDAPEDDPPYTLDNESDHPTYVSICYRGTPEDTLCVAHEFGHALQYELADGRFVPPIVREIAAFLSEIALLDFSRLNQMKFHKELSSAWEKDNRIYLVDDAKTLVAALKSLGTEYTYRLNYPLARMLANNGFSSLQETSLTKIFQGRTALPELLFVLYARTGSTKMNNYLPEVPEASKDITAIDAYRSLGMMALLDIDYWQGEPEKTIEEYYELRLAHMQAQTVLVAIGKNGKPIGYAAWEIDKDDSNVIHLKRQAAPFGDHLELLEELQIRFPENAKVMSHHSRSAREEQVAW